jgi:hypothetical protein
VNECKALRAQRRIIGYKESFIFKDAQNNKNENKYSSHFATWFTAH